MTRRRTVSLGAGVLCLLALTLAPGVPAASVPAATSPKPAVRRPAAQRPASAAKRPAAPTRKPLEIAASARVFEEAGAYGLAAADLRELRRWVPPDADLELALALDEARIGLADSAWARLHTPLMQRALEDTAGMARRTDYPFQREPLWVNGRFDGWYWYVARARAELALERRDWPAALESALVSASARPMSGQEMLLLALGAARTGQPDLAQAAVTAATILEPALPEAQYLRGLLAWRAGRRSEAQERFRAASELDADYRAPALALPRTLLAGMAPDSLPATFLTGARACLMLTSPERPKLEEFVQMDQAPGIISQPQPPLPEALREQLHLKKPLQLYIHVLVSEAGLPLAIELPYLPKDALPAGVVAHIAAALPQWRFRAPVRHGQPQRGWATVEYTLEP